MIAVGRSDSRTVALVVALSALLSVSPTVRLSAQIDVHLGIGARYTSTLVHDSIVTAFDVRPAVGPILLLTASTPLEKGWTAETSVDFSWSTLQRHESSGSVDLGTVRTLAVGVALRRGIRAGVSGRIGVGGLKYLPAEESGVFREGSGTLIVLGTLGLRYEAPVAARRSLAVEARYDLHRFITPALRTVGFTSPRAVHRVAVVVSAQVLGTSP